jgi:anthranilate phosphoribosyltransferase
MPALLQALHKVVAREDLSASEADAALEEILAGSASAAQVGALLVALCMKGEAVQEVVGFARALRRHAAHVDCGPDPRPLVDTCGTGGDGAATFNISTVTAFVVAGAGARVAKHGNRSISSHCGSADVLEALGARIALPPECIAQCVQEVGIGFLFAPALHPAMRNVQPVRADLKMRTVFNLLGPLANPAGAQAQVVGVYDARLVRLLAEALAALGLERGLVVHGSDGLDEITTTGPTAAAEVRDGHVRGRTIRPEEFGIPRAAREDLAGGDSRENAAILKTILEGGLGPRRDIAVVNAAAALATAGLAADFPAGVKLASEAIDSGRAREKLERFVAFTNRAAGAAAG